MKISTDFQLQELVHPEIFEVWGTRAQDWLNCHAAEMIQLLRNEIGDKITVNDWLWGGTYIDSGVRMPAGVIGAELSAHKAGCAFDLKFDSLSTDDVYAEIIGHPAKYPFITRIENIAYTRTRLGHRGRDWLHVEAGRRSGAIQVFIP